MILWPQPLGVCCGKEQRPDHCSPKGELAEPEEGEGRAGDSGSGSGGTREGLGCRGSGRQPGLRDAGDSGRRVRRGNRTPGASGCAGALDRKYKVVLCFLSVRSSRGRHRRGEGRFPYPP